jgi:hypothetical protein
MTPKEKAEHIYLKMLKWQQDADIYLKRNIISTAAIKCALIAVDLRLEGDFIFTDIDHAEGSYDYWQKVKQEIQKSYESDNRI